MVRSKYTFYSHYEPDVLLVYNSLRGASSFLKFCGDDAVTAEDCINFPENHCGEEIFNVLLDHGIIVPKENVESSICNILSWKRIFSSGLTLIIMPTEDCNFRCAYCYEDHKNGIMSRSTAEAIKKYVAKNISSYTNLHVVWFGGEPLMSQKTIDIIKDISDSLIKICSCARRSYSSDIITNGYNLTYPIFKSLLDCKILSYQVTIDGTADTHDAQRFLATGEKTRDKIISNLLDIKNNCNKKYFSIIIRTNISLSMESSLIDHYSELSKLFSDDSRFSFFFRPVGNWGGERVLEMCDNIYDSISFRKIYNQITEFQSKYNLDFSRFASFYNDSSCSACYENSFILGFNGEVYKCSCHFDEPDNRIGSLSKEGVMMIDASKLSKWVKAPVLKESCHKCFFAPACLNMSCPIYSNEIIRSKDDFDDCPYEKKYIKETFLLLERSGCFRTIRLTDGK